MTPRNALNLVDEVVARYQGTREDHTRLQQAVMTLNELVMQAEQEQTEPETRSATERTGEKSTK